jgi:hypothetical protein
MLAKALQGVAGAMRTLRILAKHFSVLAARATHTDEPIVV